MILLSILLSLQLIQHIPLQDLMPHPQQSQCQISVRRTDWRASPKKAAFYVAGDSGVNVALGLHPSWMGPGLGLGRRGGKLTNCPEAGLRTWTGHLVLIPLCKTEVWLTPSTEPTRTGLQLPAPVLAACREQSFPSQQLG